MFYTVSSRVLTYQIPYNQNMVCSIIMPNKVVPPRSIDTVIGRNITALVSKSNAVFSI